MRKKPCGWIICFAISVSVFLIWPSITLGEIPKTMHYQGYLKDQNAVPINGTVSMKFSIWGTESGGNNPLWSENLSVEVEDGIYSVVLGQSTPINLAFDAPYYLGITVGTDEEMTPRQPLSSVPYALNSQAKAETDPTVPESVKDGITWSEVQDRPEGLDDGDSVGIEEETDPEVGTNVTGYLPKWTGTALEKGTIFDNGNVGIGTASPSTKLEVAGVIHSTDGGIKFPDGTTQTSSATGGTTPWTVSGSDIFYNGGKVGIGTADPKHQLEVMGTVKQYGEILNISNPGFPHIHFDDTAESEYNFRIGAESSFLRVTDVNMNDHIVVSHTGNVGIGDSNPGFKLTVATDEGGLDGIVVSGPETHTVRISPSSLRGQANGLVQDGDSAIIFSGGQIDTGNLVIAPWANNSTSGIRMTNTGNVGIGTPVPRGKLHITSDHDENVPKSYDNYGIGVGLVIDSYNLNGEGGWKRFSDFAALAHAGSIGSNIRFLTQGDGAVALSERLRIDSEGRVGIGTNDMLGFKLRTNGWVSSSAGFDLSSANAHYALPFDTNGAKLTQNITQGHGELDFVTPAYDAGLIGFAFYKMDGPDDPPYEVDRDNPLMVIERNGNVGIGFKAPSEKLDVNGNVRISNARWLKFDVASDTGLDFGHGTQILRVASDGHMKFNSQNSQFEFTGNTVTTGMTTTDSLKITGGADIAEPFKIKKQQPIKPGMVVSIDPENPGELKLSDRAYDHCVAGIVSGAGGINTGMVMSQASSKGDDSELVALTGRAYCYCEASANPIKPGDLLTSSDLPGHAMKVVDFSGAQGAVIGKAMTSLDSGTGLVLVLVALQ